MTMVNQHLNSLKSLCLKAIWSTVAIIGLVGCSTSEKPKLVESNDLKPTHYTLRLGEVTENKNPLPRYTPILIDWHYKNGAVKSKLGYKGWDFNRDGRFDMVQILKEDSTVDYTVFDFDFNGTIDMTEKSK